jgi:hypothetical protein
VENKDDALCRHNQWKYRSSNETADEGGCAKILRVEEGDISPFEKIKADQNFYLSSNHKLVISFDKYEVAPGYMGIVEFEIPEKYYTMS